MLGVTMPALQLCALIAGLSLARQAAISSNPLLPFDSSYAVGQTFFSPFLFALAPVFFLPLNLDSSILHHNLNLRSMHGYLFIVPSLAQEFRIETSLFSCNWMKVYDAPTSSRAILPRSLIHLAEP